MKWIQSVYLVHTSDQKLLILGNKYLRRVRYVHAHASFWCFHVLFSVHVLFRRLVCSHGRPCDQRLLLHRNHGCLAALLASPHLSAAEHVVTKELFPPPSLSTTPPLHISPSPTMEWLETRCLNIRAEMVGSVRV